jgi:hypothetical protein
MNALNNFIIIAAKAAIARLFFIFLFSPLFKTMISYTIHPS